MMRGFLGEDFIRFIERRARLTKAQRDEEDLLLSGQMLVADLHRETLSRLRERLSLDPPSPDLRHWPRPR